MTVQKENKGRVVVALGGNALGDNLDEQMVAAKKAAVAIVDLVESGYEVALIHGNGPQVGMIETAFETASKAEEDFPILPMSVCVALSQGYIGYDLQNVLRYELDRRGLKAPVATIVTQVEVDPKDAAFTHPTKPIGGFMSEEAAEKLRGAGVPVVEDSGRGYRRVVASPMPIGIIEKDVITALLEAGQIPIAAGGGGIPVANDGGQYKGMGAVVDKDRAAAKLAELIGADTLIILTAVEKVMINFGKPDEKAIDRMTSAEAEAYIEEGHFGKGSMLPKVEAAVSFVKSGAGGSGKTALITMLDKAKDGIEGRTGTIITC
ncbi:MAG: carbamate kinase [Clostridiales Family XIII bacterium]|jgi:carbamate kinase|nr:carbamate kinase [Clostridiales Family XIII bacterium]